MIRVIGLNDDVFNNIVANYFDLVKTHDQKSNMIEFVPNCEIYMSKAQVRIYCGNDSIVFLCCDYWRIELE